MKTVFSRVTIWIILLIILSACRTVDESSEVKTDEANNDLTFQMLDNINQFANDSFVDQSIMELYGDGSYVSYDLSIAEKQDYVYVLIKVLGGSIKNTPKVFLSIAKHDNWIIKGKEIQLTFEGIDKLNGYEINVYDGKLVVKKNQSTKIITFNEAGEIDEEVTIPLEYFSIVKTSEGTGLLTSREEKLILLSEPENIIDLSKFTENASYNDIKSYGIVYVNLKDEMLYLKDGIKIRQFDLVEGQFIYDEYGQEVIVEMKKNRENYASYEFMGQDENGNLYYWEIVDRTNRTVKFSLLDKNLFEPITEANVEVPIESFSEQTILLDGVLHLWREIEFKGKPSLHLIELSL